MLSAKEKLGSSVPSGCHVLSEDIGLDIVEEGSCQPEVTNFKIAV